MNNRSPFCIIAAILTLFSAQSVIAVDGALRVTAEGTVSTSGPIHVGSIETPVGQFAITEPGTVRFEMINSDSSKRWRFTNASTKFAINQVDTPGTEFAVFENGDATLLGILTENSDVNSKQDIVPVDGGNILEKLRSLEISEWSYKDAPSDRHVGPMAQDFYTTFGLGHSDTGIATLDSSGIALAAIKALIEENTSLKERLSVLENQQAEMQAVVIKALKSQQEQRFLTNTAMN